EKHICTCTASQLTAYGNKLSGPFMDRIDIHVYVQRVDYDEIKEKIRGESTKDIRKRIELARECQRERFNEEKFFLNSQIPAQLLDKYCLLDTAAKALIEQAYNTIPLSMRTYSKIVKVSRTIADLGGHKQIETADMAEALQYRELKSFYRGKNG
ncbi:MAG: ATP-binding protein, partial [Anaerovoracaceae bacterium]